MLESFLKKYFAQRPSWVSVLTIVFLTALPIILFVLSIIESNQLTNGTQFLVHSLFPSADTLNADKSPAATKAVFEITSRIAAIILYVTIFLFIVASGTLTAILSLLFYRIRQGHETQEGCNKLNQETLISLRQAITSDTYREKIKIGVFGNLLVYSPLYIAKSFGFFEDELLDVELKDNFGSDTEIAEAISEGKITFGACDPICCVWDHQPGVRNLSVLMPLVTRYGITVFGRSGFDLNAISQMETVRIASYQKGSTTYVAALTFKSWLEKRLEKDSKVDIVIEPLVVSENPIGTVEKLAERAKNADFIFLWEPQASWMRDAKYRSEHDTLRAFGLVVDKGREFSVVDVKGNEDLLWSPHSGKADAQHRCLTTGLITTQDFLSAQPDICRRVFRAVSKALIRLRGTDWAEEALHATLQDWSIKLAVENQMQIETVPTDVFGVMTGRESSFPFIQGVKSYKPEHYLQHFKRNHELWLFNGAKSAVNGRHKIKNATLPREQYFPYFAKKTQLLRASLLREES